MHAQVKSSPHDARGNLALVVETLAGANIDIEAIAPDFEWPHIRTVVAHGDEAAAMEALRNNGLEPILLRAVPFEVDNTPGKLQGILDGLKTRGYEVESVLLGATHGQNDRVRLSIGVKEPPDANWEAEAEALANDILGNVP